QELAVAVENLDARGIIDDEQPILGVDRDGPRPDEGAVGGAALAPDELRLAARPPAAREQAKGNEPRPAVVGKPLHQSGHSRSGTDPRTARRDVRNHTTIRGRV